MRIICSVIALSLCAAASHAEAPAEQPAEKGFVSLFNGKSLDGWQGSTKGYQVKDGVMICKPGGNIYTARTYDDFVFRFEFKLPPGGNNGVGIRTPLKGDPAYVGMEIQILDNSAPRYKNLKPQQYHGSIYGVVAAKRGHLKPVGEWNSEEIRCEGPNVKVTLNGTVIVEADISQPHEFMHKRGHPGLKNKEGYIGFLGHGSPVEFRNIRIRRLKGDGN